MLKSMWIWGDVFSAGIEPGTSLLRVFPQDKGPCENLLKYKRKASKVDLHVICHLSQVQRRWLWCEMYQIRGQFRASSAQRIPVRGPQRSAVCIHVCVCMHCVMMCYSDCVYTYTTTWLHTHAVTATNFTSGAAETLVVLYPLTNCSEGIYTSAQSFVSIHWCTHLVFFCIYILMCACMYVCISILMCVCVCVCTCVCVCVCVHVCACVCQRVRVCEGVCVYIYVCLHHAGSQEIDEFRMYMYVDVYVCIYRCKCYTYVYMYIQTYTYVYIRTHECIYIHVCTYICRYVCTYIYIYLYTCESVSNNKAHVIFFLARGSFFSTRCKSPRC